MLILNQIYFAVAYNLSRKKTEDAFKLLHKVLFGRRGKVEQFELLSIVFCFSCFHITLKEDQALYRFIQFNVYCGLNSYHLGEIPGFICLPNIMGVFEPHFWKNGFCNSDFLEIYVGKRKKNWFMCKIILEKCMVENEF